MHIFSGGSKLQIARSQRSDSGTYTCVASNVEGKARKSYHLTIQGTYRVTVKKLEIIFKLRNAKAYFFQGRPIVYYEMFFVRLYVSTCVIIQINYFPIHGFSWYS